MKFVQLYYTYREVISKLTDEEKGQLLDAILDYGEFGKVPPLRGNADIVFPTFAMLIDRDKAAYEEKCRKSREAARMRWHADGTQEEEKKEEKEKDTHYVRAPRKRKLKNNSEITLQKEDLFVPFWEVEESEEVRIKS